MHLVLFMLLKIDFYYLIIFNNFITGCVLVKKYLLSFYIVQALKAGLKKASVMETKRNPNAFTDFKFRRDALQGIFFNFLFLFFHFMEYSNYYIIFIVKISNLIMRYIYFVPCFALYNSNACVV